MKNVLVEGVEVFYGGDICNHAMFGIITKTTTDEWGDKVEVRWETDRYGDKLEGGPETEFYSVGIFSPEYLGHGGTRFVTKEAFDKYWAEEFGRRAYCEANA